MNTSTIEKRDIYRLTHDEANKIIAFVAKHRPNLEAHAADSLRGVVVVERGKTFPRIAYISTYVAGDYRKTLQGYTVSGCYIPRQGNTRWKEPSLRRKSLDELLELVLPHLRVETPYETACHETAAARNRLSERASLEGDDWTLDHRSKDVNHLAALLVHVADHFDVERPESPAEEDAAVIDAVRRIRQRTLDAAAQSGMWEMWSHFDRTREGA